MLRNTVYVVREGLNGGYMPDSLSFFATKRDAQAYMVDRKRDALENDYTVTGSARNGWYELMPNDASDYTLGDSIILGSVNANMYKANLTEKFESMDELIQYLNDHYSV